MATLEERMGRLRSSAQQEGPTRSLEQRMTALRSANAPKQPSLEQRAQETFGFDESLQDRGDILPLAEKPDGSLTMATPNFLKDTLTSMLLPGHVMQGGDYTPQDVTRMALDVGVPAVAGRAPAAAAPSRVTPRDLVQSAPTTEQLKTRASQSLERGTGAGGILSADRNVDMLAEMESMVRRNRLNPTLHPRSTAAFDTLAKTLGESPNMEDLQISRRIIGTAQRTVDPDLADDRRIAGVMGEMLDEYVDDMAGGTDVRQFKADWARAKKSEAIEEIIERAESQRSGFENGIRIGFEQLLKNKKRIRGFTKEERGLIKQIAQGKGTNVLKILGKLGYGTRGNNFLGGSIGTGAGSFLMGPVGAVGAPLVGGMAAKAADNAALRNAELMRAVAASGKSPAGMTKSALDRIMENLLLKGGGPVAGTQIPREVQPYDPNIL